MDEDREQKMRRLLGSRKFWAAVVGLALVIVKSARPDFPLDEGQLTDLAVLLAAYIVGTAIEDGGRRAQHGDGP